MLQQMMGYLPNGRMLTGALAAFFVPWALSRLFRLLRSVRPSRNRRIGREGKSASPSTGEGVSVGQDGLRLLKEAIGHSPDVVFRGLGPEAGGRSATLVYVEGLADKQLLEESVRQLLLQPELPSGPGPVHLPAGSGKAEDNLQDALWEILSGNTALLVEGIGGMLILNTAGPMSRSIKEPVTEAVIRGPHEGFVELLNHNIPMLRRRIKDPNLTVVPYKAGKRTQTALSVVYMKGVADEGLIREIGRRIESMDVEEVLESGFVEQLIEDNWLSVFPQVQTTERPDRTASALLEGRAAILVDGTPIALLAPVTFPMFLTAPDDYYERWLLGSLVRLVRYLAVGIALFLPSVYIAMTSYNHGLIPTKLAVSIASGREGVPFPSMIEALMMEVTIEILREAGIRLPKPIGQAVGIVGGLVIGQAAVQAGIVSPIMVIIVALTAMSSFSIAQYEMGITIRLLRFFSMMSAGVFGIYGIILFVILVMAHMSRLESFGVPYTSPFAPVRPTGWTDTFIRLPLPFLKKNKSRG